MQARAKLSYVRQSPLKMRIVADVVRGQRVEFALNKLQFMPQKAATPIRKTIESAVANLLDQSDERIDETSLVVQQITIDGAPMFKRFQPVSRGRAHRIHKRQSHLTVIVGPETGKGEAEVAVADA